MCCNVPFPYKRHGLGWRLDGKGIPLLAVLVELKEKVPHILCGYYFDKFLFYFYFFIVVSTRLLGNDSSKARNFIVIF